MSDDPELLGSVVSRVLAAAANRRPCLACNGEPQPCQYCGDALSAKIDALARAKPERT